MPDTGFTIVVWLFVGVFVLFAGLMAVGMLLHFAAFGTIAGLIARRLGEARSAGDPVRRCGHCAAALPAEATACPNCGAPST